MRKDLPPVKDKPTGKQIRADIVLHDGHSADLLVSNEVNGKYHIVAPALEFWITAEEIESVRRLFNEE